MQRLPGHLDDRPAEEFAACIGSGRAAAIVVAPPHCYPANGRTSKEAFHLSHLESHTDRGHDAAVDASGHRCPMPLLMAKRALNALDSGQTLSLTATDPGSLRDFEVFARQSGHELLRAEEADGEFRFLIKKK